MLGHQQERWDLKDLKRILFMFQMAQRIAKEAHEFGLRRVKVFVKGPGSGRESLSELFIIQVL